MSKKIIVNALRFVIVVVTQLFIFNNIYITGFIVPVFYVYFIYKLPFGTNKLLVLVLSFFTGLLIDLFIGTYGIHAAATTMVGFLRPMILKMFFGTTDDDDRDKSPCAKDSELYNFFGYIFVLTLIHTAIFMGIESFDTLPIFKILANSLFSALFILLIDFFISKDVSKQVK